MAEGTWSGSRGLQGNCHVSERRTVSTYGPTLSGGPASIPANIVEGQARQTTKEYVHFLYNARGSLEETRYHLLLARDLELLDSDTYAALETDYREVSKMLNGLIQSLRRKEDRRIKGKD